MFESTRERPPIPSGDGRCCARNLYEACEHDEAFMRELLAEVGPQLDAAQTDDVWEDESDWDAGTWDVLPTPGNPRGGRAPEAPRDDGTDAVASAGALMTMLTEDGRSGLALASWLAQVELSDLTPYDLVDAVAAWTRVASWAQARASEGAALLAEALSDTVRTGIAAPTTCPDRRRWPEPGGSRRAATAELAMRLVTTRPRAQDLVETGAMLTGLLAETGAALERGDIDYSKAQIFARHLATVPHEIAMAVEELVLPRAPHRTPPQLEKDIAAALLEVDPDHAEDRHVDARAKRRVHHPRPLPEGMASIFAVLPAPDAVALDLALDAAARTARADGDRRTTDQLRADALATMGISALSTGHIGPAPGERGADAPRTPSPSPEASSDFSPEPSASPSADPSPVVLSSFPLGALGGAPARINVTVSLDTLLGGGDPAELDGYGPITATAARALAAGGTWRRLVTDPLTGLVTDVGRTRYRPPPQLAELVRARDRTCTRPGCNVRAQACDLDHTIPYGGSSRGSTALHNLSALCTTDHALKSTGVFRVRQDGDGRTRWTTPAGHTYTRGTDATTTHDARSRLPHGAYAYLGPPGDAGAKDADPPPPF